MKEFVVFTPKGAKHFKGQRLKFFRDKGLKVIKNPDISHVKHVPEYFWKPALGDLVIEMTPDEKREVLRQRLGNKQTVNEMLYPLKHRAKFYVIALVVASIIGQLLYRHYYGP